jgi:hypothetical protein
MPAAVSPGHGLIADISPISGSHAAHSVKCAPPVWPHSAQRRAALSCVFTSVV